MNRLLVLRPEPGASRTVDSARARGLNAISIPLFSIAPVQWQAPSPASHDAVLLTSANAIHFGGEQLDRLRSLPVYAVGETTAIAARNAGFEIAAFGDWGIDRLLDAIEGNLRLVHLCGEDRREPASHRQTIDPIAVYRSETVDRPDLRDIRNSVALIHSPRAARRFAELVRERATIAIAAISEAAAADAGRGWRAVKSADRPNDDALLALAAGLCNNPGSP